MLLRSDTTHHTETVIKMDDVCAHVAFSREEEKTTSARESEYGNEQTKKRRDTAAEQMRLILKEDRREKAV